MSVQREHRAKATRRCVLAATAIPCLPWCAIAEDDDEDDQPDPVVLGIALATAPVTLEEALHSAGQRGTPISAKFDMRDGDLRLSVYAAAQSGLIEVLVDPKTGAITALRPLTDPEDLAEAVAQQRVLETAKLPIIAVLHNTAASYPESRVVSVVPERRNGHPVLVMSLLSDGQLITTSAWLE